MILTHNYHLKPFEQTKTVCETVIANEIYLCE